MTKIILAKCNKRNLFAFKMVPSLTGTGYDTSHLASSKHFGESRR